MKLLTTIVLLLSATYQTSVEGKLSLSLQEPSQTIQDIGTELAALIPDNIPKPGKLFELSKQVLFGLPEVAIFQTINKLCAAFSNAGLIKPRITPDADTMYLQLRTPCESTSYPLPRAEELLQNPDFDVNKKVVVFVTGWMTDINVDSIADMAKAYHCRGGYNFLGFNTSDSIDTLYTWSAYNTEAVGRILAEGLAKLVEEVPAENIHLVGHSLGAHIVGYAGRYFTRFTGLNITRITGLEPANPCFNYGESLSGLQRGDASFLDIIHTNPGVLGKKEPVGDVDFYAGGLAPIKPGCFAFGCSHNRAFELYTETVYPGNETDFMGVGCSSLTKVDNGLCDGPQYPMGFAVPFDLKGNYFLSVNKDEPFGQNTNGEGTLSSSGCGSCPRK